MNNLKFLKSSIIILSVGMSLGIVMLTLRQTLLAFSMSSESLQSVSPILFGAPETIFALSWLCGTIVLSVGVSRVLFAFSRFTETRGRHEYPIQNVDVPRSDNLLSVPRGAGLDHSQHERARQLAGRASRRASRQSNIGNIPYPNTESILENGREALASINHSLRESISDRP